MRVSFDTHLKVAGIALTPWTRLGPEQWLPNYVIASLYGWDLPTSSSPVKIYPLLNKEDTTTGLKKLNTPSLLGSKAFRKLLEEKLPGYDLLTYKPVSVPEELADRNFITVDPIYTNQFENKVLFRERFKQVVPMPAYTIKKWAELPPDEAGFNRLLAGRSGLVLQDEVLSGGKGTYLIKTFGQYSRALKQLGKSSKERYVIVSQLIRGRERSLQGCISAKGIYIGPLQRQIVRHPALVDPSRPGDKFCGAAILADDQNTTSNDEARKLAHKVAAVMQKSGYRGIFGIDFLLDQKGKLYVLEINPRLTGVTPLLTALYPDNQGIPFYLLHILELGHYPYKVEDASVKFDRSGALLLIHSLEKTICQIKALPDSGTYKLVNNKLTALSRNIELSQLGPGEFIIEKYMPPGMPIKPNGRLVTMQFKDQIMDKNTEELYNSAMRVISVVRDNIKLVKAH